MTKKEERTNSFVPPSDSPLTKKEERTRPLPPVADAAIFRGQLGELVMAIDAGNHTEADPVGVFATLLAGAGALLGPNGPHLLIGSIRHPLLIWPLLFGSTGTGRKGESEGIARLFLTKTPGFTEIRASGLSSGEGLIERIRDSQDEEDKGGTEDKRLLVVESEFSSVMARTKRDGSTLAAVLRQAWDGNALSVLNRTALTASGSHVAVVGHITPREFRMRLAESEMAGGTYNRFLPMYVDRAKRLPFPEPIAPEFIDTHGEALANAIGSARNESAAAIILNLDARRLWSDSIYDEFTGTDDADETWTEFIRRAAPYCLRIAALHAALARRPQVNRDDLTAAAALVRYSVQSAKYVLDKQSHDPRLDRIRRAVIAAGNKGMSNTEVSALFSRNLSKAVLTELLDQLVESGDFKAMEVATGGRPATRLFHLSSFFVPTQEAS